MRKLGLGVMVLVVVGAIYYFTTGSEQITSEIKKQVNTELTSIQKEGFSVHNREIQENSEHFVLSFDDPEKIAHFLSRQGLHTNVNDAEMLRGLKVGVDVKYLADAYSAVAFDMYPVALPWVITSSATGDDDKKALAQVEKMLEKKTFLMHITVNKLGNGFKGHMNDINEVLHGEKDVKLSMKGLTFSGDITDNAIASVNQNLETLTMNVPDEMKLTFTGLKSNYVVTGETPYDYTTTYDIDEIYVDADSKFNFTSNNLHMKSISVVKDGLASGSLVSTIDKMNMTNKGQTYAFNTFAFETNAEGVDVTAFEKLQEIDVNNEEELSQLLKQILSKGVSFKIAKCSVASIESQGQKIDGFNITAKVDLDKSFDIMALETNPMSTLSAVDANLHITLSKELFSVIAQQPQAMMALMLFQPKDVNGKKSYEVDLKDGKLLVNGMPMM